MNAYAHHEIITTPNDWRAQKLADLVLHQRVFERRTWTTASGHIESFCSIHPEFQGTLYHERAYPRDVRATLEALACRLHDDAELRTQAEAQGITTDAIEDMIEAGSAEADLFCAE